MGAVVAIAPTLAAGPPGWAVFGVVAVGMAAYGLAMSSSRHQTESASQTKDATHCRDNKWSARVHAQGKIIGGTTKSTVGAPAIFKQSPVTVSEGIGLADVTFGVLTKRQKEVLWVHYESCKGFIACCPPHGFLGTQRFPRKPKHKGGNRIDVDSYGPSNNFTE